MHYYTHNIGEFAIETKYMTFEQKGIFVDLVDHYLASGKPLASEWLANIKRLASEGAVDSVLSLCFEKDGDVFRSQKLDLMIDEYEKRAEKNRENARKPRKKAEKSGVDDENADLLANGERVASESLTTNNQEPITNNQDINHNKHISVVMEKDAPAPIDVCDEFENPFLDEPPFDFEPDGQCFDAPFGQLIDDSNLRNNEKALQNDNHVLTASQMIVLAKTLGTSLGHSARLDEIANRKTLTVGMVKKVIEDWKATRTSTGYLIGYLDNVSANPSQLNGRRKDREINSETISNGQAYAFAKKLSANHSFASVNAHSGEDMQPFIERVAEKLKDHDYFEYCRPFLVKLGCIKEAQA